MLWFFMHLYYYYQINRNEYILLISQLYFQLKLHCHYIFFGVLMQHLQLINNFTTKIMWLNSIWKLFHLPLVMISPTSNVFFVTYYFQSFITSFTNIFLQSSFTWGRLNSFLLLVDNVYGKNWYRFFKE